MKAETKIKKKAGKQLKKQKIHTDRLALKQEVGYLFRPLAICPFPAKQPPKVEVTRRKMGVEVTTKEHETLWHRQNGKIKVEILASPKYGIPFGQDVLIILYLAMEAKKQKTRKIKMNFYTDFCNTFGIDPTDGRRYQNVQKSLERIRNSKYSWIDEREETRERELHYLYIDELDVFFNPKNPEAKPVWGEQTIILSERFWYEIEKHKIPFNVESVRYLKGKPAHLNFYVWLSYRVWKAWNDKLDGKGDEKIFVPFWGENGLQQQLSSQIKQRFLYRAEVKKWLKEVKSIWKNCPVEIVKNGNALQIHITDESQLDVRESSSSEGKRLRASREAKELEAARSPLQTSCYCHKCGQLMVARKGRKNKNGIMQADFWKCPGCSSIEPMTAVCMSCFSGGKTVVLQQDFLTGKYWCPGCKSSVSVERYWQQNRLW
ncbi:MAG: hypothetical protein DRJ08_07290 [Acidobacteria bacterium]|nr:MAG: hypothetical protein DRJ08_07290 [Acidobacteriota bacterium]